MPTIASKPKSTYIPAPQGTHMARIYQFIHIGTILEDYQGVPTEMNKIRLSFELPMETKVFKEGDEPKPISVHKEFTLSMGPKANLRKFIEGIIGASLTDEEAYGFDVESLVGKECLIQIKHKTSKAGNLRDEIASAAPLMKGQVCPPQYNQTKILSYSDWNQEIFDSLPQFIKDKIESSKEYKARLTPEDKARIVALREAEKRADEEFNNIGESGELKPDDIPF